MADVTTYKLRDQLVPTAQYDTRIKRHSIAWTATMVDDGEFVEYFDLPANTLLLNAWLDVDASLGTGCQVALFAGSTQLTSDTAAASAAEVAMHDTIKYPIELLTDTTIKVECESADVNSDANVAVIVHYTQNYK